MLIGCTVAMENDEGKLAEGSILGAVCGWYSVSDGFAVVFKFVFA